MASENRRPRYQSTDVSSSNFDDETDETETETEEIQIQSDTRARQSRAAGSVAVDKSGTLPKRFAGSPGSRRTTRDMDDADDEEEGEEEDDSEEMSRREKIKYQAEKLAIRAKETGEIIGGEIRRRSLSTGKSIRKRSRSAGRAVKAASISAGEGLRNRSISAGKSLRERSKSAGKSVRKRSSSAAKSLRERSRSAGKSIGERSSSAAKSLRERSSSVAKSLRERSSSAGKRIKEGSVIAGKAVKEKSMVAGKKMRDGSKVAGKKVKRGSIVAGKKMKESSTAAGEKLKEKSKSAGRAMRERSVSAAERMKRRMSTKEKKDKDDEEEEMEENNNHRDRDLSPTRGVMKPTPRERWGASWLRSRTKTKVKFENAKLRWNRKWNRMPRPQCVRPETDGGEVDEDEEETGSRRTQVEVFEIPSRGSKRATVTTNIGGGGGGSVPSPQRLVYRESGQRDHYFSVLRNGQEVVTPPEEEEEEDDEEEYLSPMPEEEEEAEEEDDPNDHLEAEEEEEDDDEGEMLEYNANGGNEDVDEDEKELSLPDPAVAVEETCREEILGSEFLSAREQVDRHRLHLRRISSAIGMNLRRGPRIGGRIDALRETFQGRKLGEASDRRLAKRFAKFAKYSGNPAAEAILKDTGKCFERSAEVVDELEDEILSQFLHPLKTFMKSDAKMLKPKEKKLEKLAGKIVTARGEGVMPQASFDELSLRFANHKDELLESYSCILDREDEQTKRLAEIASAYTAFNHDNYVVFNATLETLKQSLDQLEKNAVKLSTFHVGEEQVRDGNSKTENNNKASSFGGGFGSIGRFIGADSGLIDAGNGTIGDHWASSSSAAALAAGQGDAGRLNGSLFTGGGLTGMIDF